MQSVCQWKWTITQELPIVNFSANVILKVFVTKLT
jgi:hypothetical protein